MSADRGEHPGEGRARRAAEEGGATAKMNDDIHALIGAYALDAVTDVERAEFEEHLLVCAECRTELAGLREATAELGGSVPTMPPPSVRDAVLSGITSIRPLPPVVDADAADRAGGDGVADIRDRQDRRLWRWLVAAAAAAAIVVGGLSWHPWTGSQPTVSAVQQVLQAPDAHRYVKHVEGATATVVYSPKLGKSVLESRRMPAAPAGHTYQLWYLTAAGKATSAGLFTPASDGSGRVLLSGDADRAAFVGVTVEPAGGSSQPTTKPIMVVPLAS